MLGVYLFVMGRIEALRSHSEKGAAAVEYGLLVALIAVAVLAAVAALGNGVKGTFCNAIGGLGFTPPADCP